MKNQLLSNLCLTTSAQEWVYSVVLWQVVMDILDLADWVLVLAHPSPEVDLSWRVDLGGIHLNEDMVSWVQWELDVKLQ